LCFPDRKLCQDRGEKRFLLRFLGDCCYIVSGSEGASERATKRVEGEPRCENTSSLSVRLSTSHPGSSATCKRTARMRSSGCCLPMGRTTNIASRTPGRPLNEWRAKASSSFQTSLCHPAFVEPAVIALTSSCTRTRAPLGRGFLSASDRSAGVKERNRWFPNGRASSLCAVNIRADSEGRSEGARQ
jgi:hypothetical protein